MVMLFDIYNLPDDIFEVVFATKQQIIVGKLLVNYMKERGREISKTEMSELATRLHDGKVVAQLDDPEYKGKTVRLTYNKRQFYNRILTPMKAMGLIDYDLYKKTYKLSDRFTKAMTDLSRQWAEELKKEAVPTNMGRS
ncbi:hypothetical protein J4460_05585 [Candidatus Woesearchaeota archaeon]|nr:MAG: hypothetical protein QS99_C0015G0033 [archaeon GW2011_AR4]MBS3130118.1 hypothetical protein [Candidatus Woesearchaeota archaeon]HIH38735.1 hypothetical protein [Candidatus Woesearchaeota archaeon]HIJ03623.1 hypothetical protein [Candidatus Woesearchaeota archaeon]